MKRKREAIEEGGKDEKKRSKDVSGETRKGKDWREEGGEERGGMEREEGSRREEKERGGKRAIEEREREERLWAASQGTESVRAEGLDRMPCWPMAADLLSLAHQAAFDTNETWLLCP